MIAPSAPGCLTADELAAFHLGELPEEELPRVAAHLESCTACDQAAGALDTLIDPTLAAYRQTARTAPPPDSGALPNSLPGYELLAELGRGGMGVVYKARDRRLQRVVALKMLLGGDFADREHRQRFRAEAEAVARLQHPNIVQLFEAGEHDPGSGSPRPYFTLEYVDGGSLDRRLAGRPLPPRQAAEWLEPLARAVHFAHTQGIIHRDLKPSNVLLTADGTPKVCDFGVAKLLTDSDQKTVSGMILGTVEYMAPEQAAAKDTPGPAADVYALGVILYEMLAGRPPFQGATTLDTLNQVQGQEPVPVRRLQPAVPRDLETICLKCLAKEPGRRYPSAEALADDLRRFLAGEPIVARPAGTLERAVKLCRRRPVEAGLAAAVVVALAAGAGVATWQWQRAVTERNTALGLAGDLRAEREAAEWQTYRAKVAAAAGSLQLNNTAAARRHLEAAPAQYRNWEWRHLVDQLDAAQVVLTGHTGQVQGLAFTPDGRRLASVADRTARLWDVAARKSLAVWTYDKQVLSLALRADGGRLACATLDGTVHLHDPAAPSAAAVRGTAGTGPHFLAFFADGDRVCVGPSDGTVAVLDAATGATRAAFRDPKVFSRALAVSPDGRTVAIGGPGRVVRLWDAADDQPGEPLIGHATLPLAAAFSPDGQFLVTAAQHPDDALRLWRVAGDRRPVAVLTGHTGQVSVVAYSPDGSRIVSAGEDKAVRLWDGATGRPVATLAGHTAGVHRLAFSPDGRRLVTASDDLTLRVWDVADGQPVAVLRGHTGAVRAVAVSPDGTWLASGSSDGTVRLWDMATVGRTDVLRGHKDIVSGVCVSPDGGRIISVSSDGTVRLWDAGTRREVGRLTPGPAVYWSAGLSPDGTLLALLPQQGPSGFLLNLADGTLVRRLPLPPGSLTCRGCVFHPDGTLVAGGGQDGSVHLWEVATGRHLAVLKEDKAEVSSLTVSPDGKKHTAEVSSLAVSPDGRHLASGTGDGTVYVWDVAARRLEAKLPGHPTRVYSVAFSADGTRLASGRQDGTVRVWDARTHAELARLRHDAAALAVRFHPDGTRLAVGCGDGTVRLWDTATNEEVAELRGHGGVVPALAFSPDGHTLVSGSNDFTVRVWGTKPQRR